MSTQAAAGANLAGLGPRLISGIIDGVIVYVIEFLIGLVLGLILGNSASGLASLVGLVVGIVYFVYYWSMKEGQTPGKKLMGLRVVKVDGTPITPATAFIRYIGYLVNTVLILLGWVWVIIDAQHQGFHDKMAGTIVVTASK